MFADCEGCVNCTEMEDRHYCERYGTDIDRIHSCEEWDNEKE